MELKLVPKLQQSLVMTPQLKMAIKLLTLNHLELKDAVAQELIDNPVLEEMPDDAPRAGGIDGEGPSIEQNKAALEKPAEVSLGADGVDKAPEQNIDWESYADSYNFLPPSAGSGRDTQFDDLPGIDQTLTRSETLEEHLLWQIRMSDMNELEMSIALRLLGEMSDDGFLDSAPIRQPGVSTAAELAADAKAAARAKKPNPNPASNAGPPSAPNGYSHAPAHAPSNGHSDDDDDEDMLADGPAAGASAAVTLDDDEAMLEDGEEPAMLEDGPDQAHLMEGTRIDPVLLVAQDLDVPLEWVENVRKRVMQMDPVGVMARDLRECLLAQLEVWGYDDECLVWQIVDLHMKDAEKHNFAAIARNCKSTLEDVGEAMKIVEQLEPRPARNFIAQGTMPDSQYITPDVYIVKMGDEFVISLNEDGLPKLKMSRFYLDKIREAQQQRAAGMKVAADPSRTYIKDKMRSATWLIKSIHQRQRTIYRVVESILKHQRDWFDGTGPLRPLILKEVADDIEMHESTVSRVTSRKYMHTPRGVYELKYFFNSSINTGDGANIASEAVKDEIKRIISAEEPKRPLSDAAIVKMLAEKNIDIARRTVAKYREMLGILPSNKRKKVF
jgi:RNA polymerase sigma-54 factor